MADSTKKNTTNEIPMVPLGDAINLTVTIREKALETAPMPEVAKGCGYANPTSTPFYRSMTAARLFKLLGSPKPELTRIALDYLKPETENAKQNALVQSITGIPVYAELIQQHVGKRFNTQLVSNSFEKKFSLTDAGARVCAQAFIDSLKFAGYITLDGTVAPPAPGPKLPSNGVNFESSKTKDKHEDDNGGETQTQMLYLDSTRKRKITITAPLTVTKEELERIRSWLGFQLIVEEPKASTETQ